MPPTSQTPLDRKGHKERRGDLGYSFAWAPKQHHLCTQNQTSFFFLMCVFGPNMCLRGLVQFLDKERMKFCAARGGFRFETSRSRLIYALAFSSLTACSFNFFLINSTLSQKAPAFCALIFIVIGTYWPSSPSMAVNSTLHVLKPSLS